VVTSERLGAGSVLVRKEKRESPGEAEWKEDTAFVVPSPLDVIGK